MEQELGHKGFSIHIVRDDYPENPREAYDYFTTMVCFHRRYALGDKHDFTPDTLSDFIKNSSEIIYLPIYMMDHGSVAISTNKFSCPWDSGQIGYIYAEKETVKEEQITLEQAYEHMKLEVEVYNDYVNGDVFGYKIMERGEGIESCWGFYGDPEKSGSIDAAKDMIDSILYRRKNEWNNYENFFAQI